jgi:uncharacterized protein YdeI (YjbR/CyaY-like superfamily)
LVARWETAEHQGLPLLTFPSVADFEAWLRDVGDGPAGVWLKFGKGECAGLTISKAQAVETSLRFGWIDGQLGKFDDQYWLTRFTPRKAKSKWSEVNRKAAIALIEAGRMEPGGLAQVEAAKADGRWDDAYAPASTIQVPPDLEAALAQNPAARAFFATLTGSNRYALLFRLHGIKTPATRAKRIETYIAMLERGETIHGQPYKSAAKKS